jgi:predicted nuclease with TOPRIM domain
MKREEMELLVGEKNELRTKLAELFVITNHPTDLVVMELIREAAQRAREFSIPLDYCLNQFRGEYGSVED